ncbi:hypothetical protein NCCP2716_23980 [Sporosarcina sp. NCCP-2716]|uniref:ATP-binding protein n=1 Tax=Sporosarcina sp. NCCP-2716 TaxID=2943679 RepID=UPI0020400957|nr:AAA family ATPase [Sporosarcina sp. NCCP-2716]GKV69900.1 hypothetical protein NCCP2716_23980 [Sporosarcina sp. NCCP-2716]
MKIEQLTIYGFGRHQDVTIRIGERITVFCGKNEAGKTTIYQFILHILFGFPPKNSALLRYEPKNGAPYGGRLSLIDDRLGLIEVERIRGKSAGDVTIRFEDGTTAGEEKLAELLRQYDRTAFESIFSFSLFQLQGLDQMDADELSRTLLSSGTTGIDLLMQLEKRLEKEKADLFKKSGKNPHMNVLLKELRELEAVLKEQRARVDEYEPSMIRLRETEQAITEKRQELERLRAEDEQLQNGKIRLPIEANRERLLEEIERLGDTDFPPNGIREQEMLEGKRHETEAVLSRSRHQLDDLDDQLAREADSGRLGRLEELLAKEPDWHALLQEKIRLSSAIEQASTERQRLLDRLGANDPDAEEALLQADSSLASEQYVQELASRVQQTTRDMQSCKADCQRAAELTARAEEQLSRHGAAAPSDEDLAQAQQWPSIRQRLAEAKAYMAFAGTSQANTASSGNWLLLAVAVAAAVYGLAARQWSVVAIGVVIAAIGAAALFRKQPEQPQQDCRKDDMAALLKAYEGREEDYERLCRQVGDYTRKEEQLTLAAEQHSRNHQALTAELARRQEESRSASSRLEEALRNLGLPGTAAPGAVPELFRMMNELQGNRRRQEELTGRLGEVRASLQAQRQAAESFLGRELPETDLYTSIRQETQTLRERHAALEAEQQQRNRLKRLIGEKQLELQAYEQQEQHLFRQASAADKASFYGAYDRHQHTETLRLQVKSMEDQLRLLPSAEDIGLSEDRLARRAAELEERRTSAETELSQLTDERAALLHKTNALLEEEAHLLTSQLFESKKAEFNELALKWAGRQTAAEAIRQTMADLKEKKLPSVLERANRMFRSVTDGAYESLIIDEQGRFRAKRKDGQAFSIAELSQATKEQAYLVLRLSLAGELKNEAPFPILMDDPFVHFDGERLARMTAALSGLSSDHQLIVFTCHEELLTQWTNAEIINVSDIRNSQEAVKA